MISIFYRKKREGVNSIETVFSAIENYLPSHVDIRLPYEGASPISLLKNILFAYKHRTTVNHITGDAHYIAIGLGRNTVLTIHDVQSALRVTNPLKRFYIKLLWFYIPALIVKKITVISDFTRKELETIISFAKHKIVVVHNPFYSDIQYSPSDTIWQQPVILHLGTKENKNLERVAEAIEGMSCKLVVLGKMASHQHELMKDFGIAYESYYDLPYNKVLELYRNCDVVSFPSTYEGFGLPVLEANAIGRPILAGDIEVLHEVAGDAAYFVTSTDANAIRQGFLKLIGSQELRSDLILKGLRNVKRFAPNIIASKYNELYNTLSRG